MAEIFKFFNSAPGDERWHYASDFADYFGGVLSDGILHTDKQTDLGLRVSVVTGTLTTKVSVGKAIIKGYAYENTTDLTLKHDIPEPTLKRIDRIVLRLDLSNSSRYVKLFVKKGASATSPIAPTLQRDQYIHELSLAQVLVRENTTQLLASDLKDERMIESLCGLVSSIISVPTTQFQEQWDTWFESVKNEGFAPYTDTGFKENLKTTDKTNLVNAINEVFTSGNNVKKNVVDTLLSLDNTLPINTNSPWDKITESLPNVSGKSPMNVFIQPTEPVKKEGIWFKTAESNKPDVEDYKYDPKVNSMNTTLTTLTPPLANDGSLHFYNGNVYHLHNNNNTTRLSVNMYDVKLNTWKNIKNETLSRGVNVFAGPVGEKVYTPFGTQKLLEYNLQNNTIAELSMPVGWDDISILTASGSKIYGLKHRYSEEPYYLVIYDLVTKTIREVEKPKTGRQYYRIYSSDNKVFVQDDYNFFHEFDIITNTWLTETFIANESGDFSGNRIVPISDYDVISIGGYYRYDNSYSFTYAYNTLTKIKTISNYLRSKTAPIICKGDQNHIYCITSDISSGSLQFSRLTYNNQIIKGVNIDNSVISSVTNYKAALNSMKTYKSAVRLENNFIFAHISKDGKTKLRNIPTYFGNGTNWTIASSIK